MILVASILLVILLVVSNFYNFSAKRVIKPMTSVILVQLYQIATQVYIKPQFIRSSSSVGSYILHIEWMMIDKCML